MQPRCTGETKSGKRCNAWTLPGSPYCVNHDPARVTDLAAWRRQGGQAKSNASRARKRLALDVLTPAEVQGLLGRLLQDVVNGETEPAIATAAASVARALIAAREATELEQRVAELEALATGRRSA